MVGRISYYRFPYFSKTSTMQKLEGMYICMYYVRMYVCMYVCVYVCVCIYIYREREREGEGGRELKASIKLRNDVVFY